MRVLYPGHRYALPNIGEAGEQVLQFRQTPPHHDPMPGTSNQEVLRAMIERVSVLHREEPWRGNMAIIFALRQAIAYHEMRAWQKKAEKRSYATSTKAVREANQRKADALCARLQDDLKAGKPIEVYPTGKDGHIVPNMEAWVS